MKTIHDLFPDINDRTRQERLDNAMVLGRLRQGSVTHEVLREYIDRAMDRVADVSRFLQETEGKIIDCVVSKQAGHWVHTHTIRGIA